MERVDDIEAAVRRQKWFLGEALRVKGIVERRILVWVVSPGSIFAVRLHRVKDLTILCLGLVAWKCDLDGCQVPISLFIIKVKVAMRHGYEPASSRSQLSSRSAEGSPT